MAISVSWIPILEIVFINVMVMIAVVGMYLKLLGNGKTITGLHNGMIRLFASPTAHMVTNIDVWGYPPQIQDRIHVIRSFYNLKKKVMMLQGHGRLVVVLDQAERFLMNRLSMDMSQIYNLFFLNLTRKLGTDVYLIVDDLGQIDCILAGNEDHPGHIAFVDIPNTFKNNITVVKRFIPYHSPGKPFKPIRKYRFDGSKYYDHYDTTQIDYRWRENEIYDILKELTTNDPRWEDYVLAYRNKRDTGVDIVGLYQYVSDHYQVGHKIAKSIYNAYQLYKLGLLKMEDIIV